MTFRNIYELRDAVKKLDSFKKMTFIQKNVLIKRNNLRAIENSLNVIKNIGFSEWDSQTRSTYLNRLIIKEIQENGKEIQ